MKPFFFFTRIPTTKKFGRWKAKQTEAAEKLPLLLDVLDIVPVKWASWTAMSWKLESEQLERLQ